MSKDFENFKTTKHTKAKEESFTIKKALKDHLIVQNDYRLVIKKGESYEKIPVKFKSSLIAEGVIN